MKLFYCCLIARALWACDSPSTPAEASPVTAVDADAENYTVLNISNESFIFDLAVPRDIAEANEVAVNLNEAFGHLQVTAGKFFDLEITQEQGSLEQLRTQLDETLIFEYEIVEESEGAVLYRQSIPGEGNTFWHIYAFMSSGGEHYLFRDVSQSELSEAQSRMIFDAMQRTVKINTAQRPT